MRETIFGATRIDARSRWAARRRGALSPGRLRNAGELWLVASRLVSQLLGEPTRQLLLVFSPVLRVSTGRAPLIRKQSKNLSLGRSPITSSLRSDGAERGRKHGLLELELWSDVSGPAAAARGILRSSEHALLATVQTARLKRHLAARPTPEPGAPPSHSKSSPVGGVSCSSLRWLCATRVPGSIQPERTAREVRGAL
jgi:hypothetical protein